jgi:hypothetical protein
MNGRYRILLTTLAILLCAGVVSLAQDEPDLQAIAAGIKLNQEALRGYSWQSRVSLSVDGEQKKVDLFQVRYDSDDQLQKTRVGGEADSKKVRGPIRKQAAKKKKKEAGEFADETKDLLAKYTEPATLQKAIANAFARTEDGLFKLQAQDVVVKGDSILIEVVPATKQPVSLKVETAVEDGPVVLNIVFQKLADGTNYVAQSTIDSTFEKKKIEVVTENFSHVKQGG